MQGRKAETPSDSLPALPFCKYFVYLHVCIVILSGQKYAGNRKFPGFCQERKEDQTEAQCNPFTKIVKVLEKKRKKIYGDGETLPASSKEKESQSLPASCSCRGPLMNPKAGRMTQLVR